MTPFGEQLSTEYRMPSSPIPLCSCLVFATGLLRRWSDIVWFAWSRTGCYGPSRMTELFCRSSTRLATWRTQWRWSRRDWGERSRKTQVASLRSSTSGPRSSLAPRHGRRCRCKLTRCHRSSAFAACSLRNLLFENYLARKTNLIKRSMRLPRRVSSLLRRFSWLYKKLYESVMRRVGLLIESKAHPFKCLLIWKISLSLLKIRDRLNN